MYVRLPMASHRPIIFLQCSANSPGRAHRHLLLLLPMISHGPIIFLRDASIKRWHVQASVHCIMGSAPGLLPFSSAKGNLYWKFRIISAAPIKIPAARHGDDDAMRLIIGIFRRSFRIQSLSSSTKLSCHPTHAPPY